MYRNNKQIVFAADLMKPKYAVSGLDGKSKLRAKRDDAGEFLAINALVIAQNTEMAAKADGPEHGRKPQKREITLLVNEKTGDIVPTPFKETVKVDKNDIVVRELAPYAGGGQLARVDVTSIENLEEAVLACLGAGWTSESIQESDEAIVDEADFE